MDREDNLTNWHYCSYYCHYIFSGLWRRVGARGVIVAVCISDSWHVDMLCFPVKLSRCILTSIRVPTLPSRLFECRLQLTYGASVHPEKSHRSISVTLSCLRANLQSPAAHSPRKSINLDSKPHRNVQRSNWTKIDQLERIQPPKQDITQTGADTRHITSSYVCFETSLLWDFDYYLKLSPAENFRRSKSIHSA